MNEKLQVQINRVPGSFNCQVVIYSKHGEDIFTYSVGKYGELNADKHKHGEPIKATFVLDEQSLRNLLTSFAEEAKGRGIETHESYVKGKLEATESHLEDMRNLVFKK